MYEEAPIYYAPGDGFTPHDTWQPASQTTYLALGTQVDKCTSTDQAKAATAAVRARLHYAAKQPWLSWRYTQKALLFARPSVMAAASKMRWTVAQLPTSNAALERTIKIRYMIIYLIIDQICQSMLKQH